MGTGPLSDEEAEQALVALEDDASETKRVFQEAAADSARAIVRISHFGSNERTKLAASQYVIDRVLGRIQDTPTKPIDSPYASVMRGIIGELKNAAGVDEAVNEFIHQEAIRPDPGDKRHQGKISDIYTED
jgi:hypothetical protein